MKRTLLLVAAVAVAALSFGQIKKPELMVFPSDAWCISNGYYTEVENMDETDKVPNYKQALQENIGLKLAIAKINDLMAERQFPLQSLEQAIRNVEQRRAEDNLTVTGRESVRRVGTCRKSGYHPRTYLGHQGYGTQTYSQLYP